MSTNRKEWIMTPEHRYQTDAEFKALVDVLEYHIHSANFTPSEIRAAAVLACIRYEMRRPRPVFISSLDEHTIKPKYDPPSEAAPVRRKYDV